MTRISTALLAVSCALGIVASADAMAELPPADGCDQPAHQAANEPALRRWRVEDSIAVRYFVADLRSSTPGTLAPTSADDAAVLFSPSGRRFLFVSYHGDLARDEIVYELQIFDTAAVASALASQCAAIAPVRVLRRRSASSLDTRAAIRTPSWEDDDNLLFLGVEGTGPRRIFRYDVARDQVIALTGVEYDAGLDARAIYGVRGRSVAFVHLESTPWTPLDAYPGVVIGSAEGGPPASNELASRFLTTSAVRNRNVLHASYRGRRAVRIGVISGAISGPWVSPDGRWAIAAYAPSDSQVRPEWLTYATMPTGQRVRGIRYMLIDLLRGTATAMVDAPIGTIVAAGRNLETPTGAAWAPDSSRVLIFNTALPLSEDRGAREAMAYVVDYDVRARNWRIFRPIVENGTRLLAMRMVGEDVVFTTSNEAGSTANSQYRFSGGAWRARPGGEPRVSGGSTPFRVEILQGPNEPPRVVASAGDRIISLSGPDPALRGVRLARTESVAWTGSDGSRRSGLLTLPPDHQARTTRLPLVIQGFSYEPNLFRPDGVVGGFFATQAFAAQGFAVLQVPFAYDNNTTMMTPAEAPARVAQIDDIIAHFSSTGLIDPDRVGLIGFSRSGYSTYYTITHPGRHVLAAAAVFDSVTASYGEYVLSAGMGDSGTTVFERQYGDGSFWQNPNAWLEHAPSFNVHRVQTPSLFAISEPWGAAETLGAFILNRRPIEYLVMPQASHQPQRPRERHVAMQASIGWMNFWLRGREETALGTADQYERWRRLRAQWQRQQAWEAAGNRAGSVPDASFEQ